MQKRIMLLTAVVAAGAFGIWGYQRYTERYPSTEDAYVEADVVRVAPRVSGRVASLNVTNHQRVEKGEELFKIDPTPFEFALQKTEAQLALARREYAQADAALSSVKAEVHNREVLLENARTRLQRTRRLYKKAYVSDESVTDAQAEYKSAQASLKVARAKYEETKRQLGKPGEKNDRIVRANAMLDQARWALDNTTLHAACSGQISELNLRPGNVVNADKNVFVLVCSNHYWVDANFKETQLEHIQPGQPVKIEVDMYPDYTLHGVVEHVSAAAGSVFSLLPPQNANGNWVKVIQRVPVRIRIENADHEHPLLVGTSAAVTVDTTTTVRTDIQHASNQITMSPASISTQ
jgi:membrane fusion protein (multidrug efflux system)